MIPDELYWGIDDVREGWFFKKPSGETISIHGPSICESSGGGINEAIKKALILGCSKQIYAPFVQHLDVNGNKCFCSKVLNN